MPKIKYKDKIAVKKLIAIGNRINQTKQSNQSNKVNPLSYKGRDVP